ncbi:MAG: ATP-binding protein [Bacteroidia bacterium]|nr:ATP-binding protein [Bacteroidia bacterium]
MYDKSINLLEEIDNVSKIHLLDRNDIDKLMLVVAERIVAALHIERVSAWLFNQERNAIISMGEYDIRTKKFAKDTVLSQREFPRYFKALNENPLILAENIFTHPATVEFSEHYSKPLGIISLMDIPLRIAGELVGVMCFEKTGAKERVFNEKEQTFAYSMSLIFASNLEARYRRAAQTKLDEALHEKDLLIKEINHRVKNNFAILISLLRLSKSQGKILNPKQLLEEFEQRIFSMLKIQDLLYQSQNYTSVNLSDYLKELTAEFSRSQPEMAPSIRMEISNAACYLPSKTAIHLGLIVTEIFLNSVKYSFPVTKTYEFLICFKETDQQHMWLKIGDNGVGFDFEKNSKDETLGLLLIKDFSDDIDAKVKFPVKGNCYYEFLIERSEK